MRIFAAVCATLALLALVGFARYGRGGYESPAYRVVVDGGSFQVREYPSMVLAITPMNGLGREDGESFMRLFGYISGGNAAGAKISMTTPVFMSGEGEGGRMAFVVPREQAEKGAPAATGPDIRIEPMPGGQFAAYRFSGRLDPEACERARRELERWIREQGLRFDGPLIVAGYDPPFIPPFLRRNEVLFRIGRS
jgi:hypothetical protein